jgi:hypothetical protein
MTQQHPNEAELARQVAAHHPGAPSNPRAARIWLAAQIIGSLGMAVAVLLFLIFQPYLVGASSPEQEKQTSTPNPVRITSAGLIHIAPGTPLHHHLEKKEVQKLRVQYPLLTVTGAVVASPRGGEGNAKGFWQFNTAELLSTYADWEKAVADVVFQQTQLKSVKQLAEQRVKFQTEFVARMKKLVAAGTDTKKDLASAENDLLQFKIQGQKEVHEAEKALRDARKSEASLHRQLQQGGIEPELLREAKADEDIVVAEVPEAKATRVKIGQRCTARFFALPDQVFAGKVVGISPVIAKEKRTLRVQFTIRDAHDQVRPGMFAEIGVGTDPHEIILMPLDGVLHVGRADYALVRTKSGDWRAAEVRLGERHGNQVEVLVGLKVGDSVLGRGAILLKPVVTQLLAGGPTVQAEAVAQKEAGL